MRMHGHAEHDPADYVPQEMFEEWSKKDPVELFENVLLDAGVIDADTREAGQGGRPAGGHRRAGKALADPMPDPSNDRGGRLCRLTAPARPTYLEAVGLALDSEMDRDPDVFIIGEDVGQFGGAFKVTKGFLDKFGAAPGGRHPDRRDRLHRPGRGRGAGRAAAGGGVPVRRLHLLRLRPDHQRAGPAPLAHRRPDAGDHAGAVRRPAAGRARPTRRAWRATSRTCPA